MALRTDFEIAINAQSSVTGEWVSAGATLARNRVEGGSALKPLENREEANLSMSHERILRYNYGI
jgi:hypothetical protein